MTVNPQAAATVTELANAKAPKPLVPPECDLRGLPSMLLDVQRLKRSDLATHSTGDEFKAAMLLWCESWQETPAASLPDDDRKLAHWAGVTPTRWKRLRAGALRGWVKCSDGRLYHSVLAEKAKEAWEARLAQRERAAKRWGRDKPEENRENLEENAEKSAKNPPFSAAEPKDDNGLGDAAALPEKGKGKVKGKEEETEPPNGGSGGAAPPPPAARTDLGFTGEETNAGTESEPERLRRALWSEARGILKRLAPAMAPDLPGSLIGELAKYLGRGTRGGARAVQKLRDVEAMASSGEIAGYGVAVTPEGAAAAIEKYLRGIINAAKKEAEALKAAGDNGAVIDQHGNPVAGGEAPIRTGVERAPQSAYREFQEMFGSETFGRK